MLMVSLAECRVPCERSGSLALVTFWVDFDSRLPTWWPGPMEWLSPIRVAASEFPLPNDEPAASEPGARPVGPVVSLEADGVFLGHLCERLASRIMAALHRHGARALAAVSCGATPCCIEEEQP